MFTVFKYQYTVRKLSWLERNSLLGWLLHFSRFPDMLKQVYLNNSGQEGGQTPPKGRSDSWHGPGSVYSWWLSGKGHARRRETLLSEGQTAPKESARPHIPTERQGHLRSCCLYLDKAKRTLVFTDPESRKGPTAAFSYMHLVSASQHSLPRPLPGLPAAAALLTSGTMTTAPATQSAPFLVNKEEKKYQKRNNWA